MSRLNDIVRQFQMKKILTFSGIVFITLTVHGQLPIERILNARALNEAGKPDQAIELVGKTIDQSGDYRLFLVRAESYILKGDYSSATSDFNEANRIVPSSGEYGLARIYAIRGDAATSLYHLELNMNSLFKKDEKDIMLEKAFGTIENSSAWRQFWKKEWYSISEKAISEIEYYNSIGKFEESRVLLSELKKNFAENSDIIYAEALINLASGRYSEVISPVSEMLNLNPDNEKFLRILAKAQAGSSNPAGASATYTKIIDSGTVDAELLLLRADCFRKTGEVEKARIDIQRYLEIYPENKSALSLAGKVELQSGDNLKALEYFSKNLEIHPDDPDCYIDRANSYFISKSWDWAIKDYSMSLDLKPGNSDIWLNKGIALLNSGRVSDACHDFRKSFSLGNKKASEQISRYCIK